LFLGRKRKVGAETFGVPFEAMNARILDNGSWARGACFDCPSKLSENRAAAVKHWLAGNAGVQASRIRTIGLVETKPLAPNASPDGSDNAPGRQKNRRVELTPQTR
jgi:hypothetical protein